MELKASQCRAQVCRTAKTVEISQRCSSQQRPTQLNIWESTLTRQRQSHKTASVSIALCNSRNTDIIAKTPEYITAMVKSCKALIYLPLFVFPLSRGYHLTAAHLSARETAATRQPCHCLATCCSLFCSVPSTALCGC